MFPTLARVLELPVVRRGLPVVLAGSGRLDRPVRWVHVSELPDVADVLRGGELVLTTGIALPEDGPGLTRYVRGLAGVGAAGLVVEFGRRYTDALPRALLDTAERCGLPVVGLRRELRFVAVTEAVHALVVNAQLEELRIAESVHRTFDELAVEGAEPEEVVREVARLAGGPVVLENLAHRVLAHDAAGGDPEGLLEDWERRSRAVRPDGRTGYDPGSGWLVTAVGARGEDWGRLVLAGEPGAVPEGVPHRQATVLERGATALALNRLLVGEREGLERRAHRALLSGVLTHALTAADVALRSAALGVPLEGRRLVGVVLRGREGAAAVLQAQARLRDLAERAAAAVRERRMTALVGGLDDGGVGLLVSLGPYDDEHTVLEGFATAVRRVTGEGPGVGREEHRDPVVAVGSPVHSVREARRTLLEATRVADAAQHAGPGRPGSRGEAGRAVSYFRLADVRLRGLLRLLREDSRLQTYVERELGPLLAYDAEHGTRLVDVLRCYLEHGRNKSAAAEAAHLSRPSFYSRLHRVERILAVDLTRVEPCLSLHVALVALDAVRG